MMSERATYADLERLETRIISSSPSRHARSTRRSASRARETDILIFTGVVGLARVGDRSMADDRPVLDLNRSAGQAGRADVRLQGGSSEVCGTMCQVNPLHQTEVLLRPPRLTDESEVGRAQAELAADDFDFVFQQADESWSAYVARVEREQRGRDLDPGRVPNTFLFAEVGGELVGRVSIRHELNDYLAAVGGHIGYAVRPAYRRRGYARSILRQSLQGAKDLGLDQVLITCDDDNVASARLIEAFGGILENVITPDGSSPTRRYWIDLTSPAN